MAAASPDPAPYSGPLFITGMWRSGSSLLYALLNKHPRVALMYEADLILMRQAFWTGGRDWARRWEAWNGAPGRHGLDIAKLERSRVSFREAFELAHLEYARRKGAIIWGDKSPDLFDRLAFLPKTFPAARFIVVWRHPEATLSSMQRAADQGARFFGKRGMALRGLIGNWQLRRQTDDLLNRGVPVCEITFDELVARTERVMRRVCEFAGVPFDPDVTSLTGAQRESIHDGPHHSLLRGERIVASRRASSLPEETREKIGRYMSLWSRQHGPGRPWWDAGLVEPGKLPGLFERFSDYSRYRAYRVLDEAKRLGFCLAPLQLINRHRQRTATSTPRISPAT